MNTGAKIAIVVAAGLMLFGMIACGTLVDFSNTSVELEAAIKTQYKANQAVHDKVWKTIAQDANVATAHADRVKEIVIGSIEGRYGNDTNVVFKAINEATGQTLPTELFAKVQQVIEAGQAEFANNQRELLSKKQTYELHLHRFPNSIYASMLGYPRIDMDQFDIVTSERTDRAFADKKEEPLMPFTK